MTEKRMLDREKERFDVDGDTLQKVLEKVTRLITEYGPEATIDEERCQYDEGKYLAVFVKEPETDEEFKLRVATETHYAQRASQYEAAEYLRLKAKFEST